MRLGIVIPAKNEAEVIGKVIIDLAQTLDEHRIDFEIIVVNDGSTDDTVNAALDTHVRHPALTVLTPRRRGFGRAVRAGLLNAIESCDAVALCMGDGSDYPIDLVRCYEMMVRRGADCVFGSRFIEGSGIEGYPLLKLAINRAGNKLIQVLWQTKHNDITNAFKLYRINVIKACMPTMSRDFAVLVELPLKALNRGFSHESIAIGWHGRKKGVSKFKLAELTGRYLLTLLWVYCERLLWD